MHSGHTDRTLHHATQLAAAACELLEFSAGLMRLVTVQAQNNHDLVSSFSASIASMLARDECGRLMSLDKNLADYRGALELIKVISHTIASTTLNMRSITGYYAFLDEVVGSKEAGSSLIMLGHQLSIVLAELRQLDDAGCKKDMVLIRAKSECLYIEHQANLDASMAAVRNSEKLLGATLHVRRELERCIADAEAS